MIFTARSDIWLLHGLRFTEGLVDRVTVDIPILQSASKILSKATHRKGRVPASCSGKYSATSYELRHRRSSVPEGYITGNI